MDVLGGGFMLLPAPSLILIILKNSGGKVEEREGESQDTSLSNVELGMDG